MELRPYQKELSQKARTILQERKIVYLAFEVRTGKTLTALNTAGLFGAKSVIFLTKKKAISSIESDYKEFGFDFDLTVINNESLHKVTHSNFDLLISDEHHRNGAFPKPNRMTKDIKNRFRHLPMIYLSGTMSPESYSQIYHQFWCSNYSPFKEPSFYKWSKIYVNVKDRQLGYAVVKDYSDAKMELIKPIIDPYILTFTQAEAGFSTNIVEKVLKVRLKDSTYALARRLKKNKFIIAKDGREIIADTALKEMQKLHQIYSGTVLFEDGTTSVFDLSKYEFIKEHFAGKKLGIFYKFKAEYIALKQVFSDALTNNLDEFNNTDKHIALQFQAGKEGISLKNADCLVALNIDFSASTYFQFRDRLTTKDRLHNELYWIFAENGIEPKIYEKVMSKKSFTVSIYKKEFK